MQEVSQARWAEAGGGEAAGSSGECGGADACAGACSDRARVAQVTAHMDFGACLASNATCALSHTHRCIGRGNVPCTLYSIRVSKL